MRRLDPAGYPVSMDGYVFGNKIGQQVQSSKRAWEADVLKAHGHTPTYTVTANLTAKSRAALSKIELHFHDLRGRRVPAGLKVGCRCTQSGTDSATRTSPRRVPIWRARFRRSTTPCGTSRSASKRKGESRKTCNNLQRIPEQARENGLRRRSGGRENPSKPVSDAIRLPRRLGSGPRGRQFKSGRLDHLSPSSLRRTCDRELHGAGRHSAPEGGVVDRPGVEWPGCPRVPDRSCV